MLYTLIPPSLVFRVRQNHKFLFLNLCIHFVYLLPIVSYLESEEFTGKLKVCNVLLFRGTFREFVEAFIYFHKKRLCYLANKYILAVQNWCVLGYLSSSIRHSRRFISRDKPQVRSDKTLRRVESREFFFHVRSKGEEIFEAIAVSCSGVHASIRKLYRRRDNYLVGL